MEFSKKYDPKEIENKWYDFWEEKGYFQPDSSSTKEAYTIVIPPPNVTGILHMGHALNNTIQDILIRFNRMKSNPTLWIPGTDHAGIATQNVVEKQLVKEKKNRENLGREKFLERVWQWKQEHGSTIINQLKRLGSSCDWSRLRFTMDEGLSNAVVEVFISLYKEGLIYRGNYIINWCPRCHTALSDEEVEHEETDGRLYYIKYPILDNFKTKTQNSYIIVATTRPETMLGDVAVAINPKDKRYKKLLDKTIVLPLLNRRLKVIKDSLVDPKFGTGIVKVTPGHDPNDFQMGLNHKLEPIQVIGPDGKMTSIAGKSYEGLDRIECRKRIVADLEKENLIEKIETHKHKVGHCYRCQTVIEPLISKQWFVKMKPLAKPAIEVVKNKEIKFFPKRWEKVYLNWMENIRDWCISRQIWWGHRLPVFYCKKCHVQEQKNKIQETKDQECGVIVARDKPDKCPKCGSEDIKQDKDVLDTWFSSWLWPFSTMGWPEKTKDLEKFYPTNDLVTAQEIIFFWVARMIMAGLKFAGQIPFKNVYIHGTVRDKTGTKMSKSLGNIIDPIEIIDKFGADALRFSIVSITAMGQDVFLSTEKFLLGRNFSNKIWNAARYILSFSKENFKEELSIQQDNKYIEFMLLNKWIVLKLNECIKSSSKAIENFNFNKATDEIYQFFWHEFCDWYLEMTKPILSDKNVSNKIKHSTFITMLSVLLDSLKLLHPFMPFVTEEIYQRIKKINFQEIETKSESIMISKWPEPKNDIYDSDIKNVFDFLIKIISSIRNIKSELRIPLNRSTDLYLKISDDKKINIVKKFQYFIKKLANVNDIKIDINIKRPAYSATAVIEETQIFIPLEGVIDLEKEKRRIDKNLKETNTVLKNIMQKLNNKQFLKKAPKQIIDKESQKYKDFLDKKKKLEKALKEIS